MREQVRWRTMAEKTVVNGRFRLDLNYRKLRGDEGLSIRVIGPVGTEDRELLRYDCFEKTPHFHTAVYDHNTIAKIDEDDAVSWSLAQLDGQFARLVASAGGEDLNDAEISGHRRCIEELRQKSNELVRTAKIEQPIA